MSRALWSSLIRRNSASWDHFGWHALSNAKGVRSAAACTHALRVAQGVPPAAKLWRRMILMAQHAPRFLQIVADAKKRIRETTVDDVKAKLDRGEKFVLIDVREESEWAKDHLPGAIH